jgi:general secretion pathway protein L
MLRSVLGLDLGSWSIKAVELRQTLRGVEIGQLRALPTAPDELDERDQVDGSLAERLREFATVHRLPTDSIVTALPGDRISGRRLTFPFRDRRRLSQAVPFEVESDMPFDLADVIVDWEIVGGDRTKAEVVADIAPRKEVAQHLEGLRAAGLEPRIVEAEGLVLANLAVLFPFPGVRLFADLGHRTTVLCLCADGRPLASRTVPLGGAALTRAIAEERRIPLADAERWKHEEIVLARPGSAAGSPAALGVMDRIAREIARTIAAFEPAIAVHGGRLDGLVLFGGSARLAHVDEYLAERLGVPAERIAIPPGPTGSALLAGGDPALFAPALALALRGTLQARTRRNFRQGEFAYRVDLRQLAGAFTGTARLAVVTLLLAAVLLGTSVATASRRAARLEDDLARVYGDIFPGQPVPASPIAAMRDAVRSAHERADALGLYRGNLSALDLLAEISARVPKDLEVVFEELNIDRQVVRVRGTSKTFEGVDRLRAELGKFEPFSEIQVSEIKDDEKRGGKSFSLTISLAQRTEQDGGEG